ncbi:MAG: 2-oxo acid dehydrogenase subunit E2, partial [Desulfuromonadales bacterium]|nr:2-oxo acid dehydrogenase subunit E2 [Desulfuromonadales bacterium]NIR33296.1 2-oxo acid dehydrogenase subunit E2 [Desulfuromonadales bacterium]NIS43296.1 2-oxo acid dehydrogenase subunit E2 [Desulfuromonadales bacterium]
MAYEFRLPDLGEGIAEAEIRNWLVAEGDHIDEHQAVLELETDKAVVEIPAPRAGKVLGIECAAGSTVQVGDVLMTIAEAGEEAEAQTPRRPSYGIVGELPEAEEDETPAKKPEPAETVLALPAARVLAKERGVDLTTVQGSGPRGSITRDDVLEAASARHRPEREAPSADDERIPLTGLRGTIARHLVQSQERSAFVTTMEETDVTELWSLKEREEHVVEDEGGHLTFLPFFMKAAQHALIDFPHLNATVDEEADEIIVRKSCHIGVAVDTDEGLLVPVVRDVSRKSVVELADELEELAERARGRRLERHELQGSSFSITNFGAYGSTYATPIINHPNVAILGCGKIVDKPWVVDGEVAVR